MAYRSWLKDVRHISDLGEHLHALKYRTEKDEIRSDKKEEKWLEILKRPIPVADEFKQYYGSRMHDAGLLKIEHVGNELHVKLSCEFTDGFAYRLAKLLDLKLQAHIWPVTLVLTDVDYVNCARFGPEGQLRWADWRNIKPFDAINSSDCFLFDWFHEQDQRYQWIAELWAYRKEQKKQSSSMFLMADCNGFRAIDGRKKALDKAFGPGVVPIWEDLWNGTSAKGEPVDMWHWPAGIETCLSARGMSFDDLRITNPDQS